MAPPFLPLVRAVGASSIVLPLAIVAACAQGVGDNGFTGGGDGDAPGVPVRRTSGASAADAGASIAARGEGRAAGGPDATTASGPMSPSGHAGGEGAGTASGVDAAGDGSTGAPAADARGDDGDVAGDDGLAGDDAADASSGDDGSGDDAAGDSDIPPGAAQPVPGDLLITEVMFYPSGPEPQCEWFEVYNLADGPRLLSGLTIQDGYPRTHVIAATPAVVVPPSAYVVLVRNQVAAVDELVPPSSIVYEYGAGQPAGQGVELENGTTGDLSLWSGGTLLADIPYGPWGMASLGQSIELAGLVTTGNDQPGAWCLAQYSWASGSDNGTPGAPNDCP
jgi:hypothetical protein